MLLVVLIWRCPLGKGRGAAYVSTIIKNILRFEGYQDLNTAGVRSLGTGNFHEFAFSQFCRLDCYSFAADGFVQYDSKRAE